MKCEDTLGIYIHVPFCGKKCDYCDFYSVPFRKNTAEDYVNAVVRNIRHYSDKSRITDTIYFGGGTPSLLSGEQVSRILKEVHNSFDFSSNAEITLEANPNTLTPHKLSELYESGINRLSIGVQSMNDSELKFLGRTHNAERAEKAVLDAYNAGFRNISCDLMIALPEQTEESLHYSIDRMAELPINHISAYILKVEDGTPFYYHGIKETLPDDDKTAELYLETVKRLEMKGFMQYEISNFAHSGYESRHNCRYWKCLDYIGIGCAAHSCYNGKRFAVGRDISSFISGEVQPVEITDENPCTFEEYAMLRLRLKEGLNLGDVPEYRNEITKKIPALVNAGYADFENNIVSLTPKGFVMSNSVIEYLIFN